MVSKEQKRKLLKKIFGNKQCFGRYWELTEGQRGFVCNYLINKSKYSRCIACFKMSEKGEKFEEIKH